MKVPAESNTGIDSRQFPDNQEWHVSAKVKLRGRKVFPLALFLCILLGQLGFLILWDIQDVSKATGH